MACEDAIIAILATISVVPIFLTDWGRGTQPRGSTWPWQEADNLSLFLTLGIW